MNDIEEMALERMILRGMICGECGEYLGEGYGEEIICESCRELKGFREEKEGYYGF